MGIQRLLNIADILPGNTKGKIRVSKNMNITKKLLSDTSRYLVNKYFFDLMQIHNGYKGLSKLHNSLKETQFLQPEQLEVIQFEKIKALLIFANDNVPFYKKRFEESGFDPLKFQSFDDLKIIPILTKDDIREHNHEMLSQICKKRDDCIVSMSGGTTGPSIEIYNTLESFTFKLASQHRFDTWAGWEKGDWSSIIWPAVVDFSKQPPTFKSKLKNYLSNRSILLQQTTITDDDFAKHFSEVMRRKPTIIRGFPSQLIFAANYVLQNDIFMPFVDGVITTGELLLSEDRLLIEKAFDCPVYDSYRTREAGCIAQECSEHNGKHINSDQVYIEINPQQIGAHSKEGAILVTDLVNYAMPMIRYEIGDVGRISDRICKCGRGLPMLENISGRISDLLYSTDGRQISPVTVLPNMFHLIGIDNQFRIIQEELNQITIQMVKPEPSHEKIIKQKHAAMAIFGTDIAIRYEYVNNIEPVSSGKFPIVVSKIEKQQ